MARPDNPDYVEAIERGLGVIRALGAGGRDGMSLARVAEATGLPRPTARRALLTLEALGYVRQDGRAFRLTPRVVELGCAYVDSLGVWDVVRPHLADLVARTGESSSLAQLDGGEIVYVGRVSVPKIVSIAVAVGTRIPAVATSMGRVLLADLPTAQRRAALAAPVASAARRTPRGRELDRILTATREQGWAAVDQELAVGVRSVAMALREGDGVRALGAVNICVSAAEYGMDELVGELLPLLGEAVAAIEVDLAARARVPHVVAERDAPATAASR